MGAAGALDADKKVTMNAVVLAIGSLLIKRVQLLVTAITYVVVASARPAAATGADVAAAARHAV